MRNLVTEPPEADQKICFVAMGFGRKTHYESGRTLDLDATYREIIKPAAEAAGLRCIRADEVRHTGSIDARMYELLFRADVVIADLSTDNVNAIYELGIRHALCPRTTLVMVEAKGQLHFDVNHISIFRYAHLGDDIGASEARRAIADLTELIKSALTEQRIDSPVYTFLKIERPRLTNQEVAALIHAAEDVEELVVTHIRAGEEAKRENRFVDAAAAFSKALALTSSNDAYLTQQIALSTYKSKHPSAITALVDAREIINRLSPHESNDPETLGIAGAIHKNLWVETKDKNFLEDAILFYGRGFEVRRDYYNGENLALCFDFRAQVHTDEMERQFDRMSARKVRESILKFLTPVAASEEVNERSDRRWVFATMANCLFALERHEEAILFERRFLELQEAAWEVETYEKSKAYMLALNSK